MDIIKPGLGVVIECFLSLMNEFDNEQLVTAFEKIMITFGDNMKPYAVQICKHLSDQYIRCLGEKSYQTYTTALSSFASIRRIIEVVKDDTAILTEVEQIIYPSLIKTLAPVGYDSIEEGVSCITLILYHGYKDRPISEGMWSVFPSLLYVCGGSEFDKHGGFGSEYLPQISVIFKNYIRRDCEGMTKVLLKQKQTNFALLLKFISKEFKINQHSTEYLNSVSVAGIILAIFENMAGKIDDSFSDIMTMLMNECKHQQQLAQTGEDSKPYQSMLLQVISMAFAYNS